MSMAVSFEKCDDRPFLDVDIEIIVNGEMCGSITSVINDKTENVVKTFPNSPISHSKFEHLMVFHNYNLDSLLTVVAEYLNHCINSYSYFHPNDEYYNIVHNSGLPHDKFTLMLDFHDKSRNEEIILINDPITHSAVTIMK